MRSYEKRLRNAQSISHNAQSLVDIVVESMRRLEHNRVAIDENIKTLRQYLEIHNAPIDSDYALVSLYKRRDNISRSLMALHEHAPIAERLVQQAAEELSLLGSLDSTAPKAGRGMRS